ncbi:MULTISPECIES: MFS transporter [Xanthomonas]|uniref:MFS transporter n=1 Tax=Xanthomonas TaxID=338 RepID=UPI000CEF4D7F|nr:MULTISPECIES: MFS transporter [Xanthomonas]MBB3800448.1 putative MFS family arabinose efflux permease [Xanthomonas cannabis]PPU36925.1 MFS transporter [Xanthomonas sp. CFBP 7912]RJS02117.1 MFS transporter [Xanthomonas sp. CFBP 7698]
MPALHSLPETSPAATGRSGLAIFILAFAAFVIVTTEYLIVGLLPGLARDMGISISAAGQLVTLFAFTVMLSGPPLTAWLSHLDRKRLFVAILLVFAVSNAVAALAPNIWVLAVARFLPALALPVFWGTASDTAGQLAGPQQAGRAVSRVYLGISAALLFGIPLGTVAANSIGWRGAFWSLAALSLAMAAALALWMPTVARTERVNLRQQAGIFTERFFLANVALSVVVFTAMFTAYTYLADLLERNVGVPAANVGWWLMGFGAVGLIGNWLGGRVVDRSPLRATAVFLLLLALGMALCVPVAGTGVLLCLTLAVWGIAYTALFPISQVRVMQSVGHSQALAGTTNVSAANAGIGVGAIIGGLAIPAWGLGSIGYVAAAVAALGVVLIPLVHRARR